jgi:UDP-4-amino-4,6-dideoxy-N-acetyl-beta-L-altrosamine N-acetyltransferase
MSDYILRRVTSSDLAMLLEWRNDERVRRNMFTSHIISNEEHIAWWNSISSRDNVAPYVFEVSGIPTGFLSFYNMDAHLGTSSWTFHVSPNAAPGKGSQLEFLALDEAFLELKIDLLQCEVLSFNKSVINLHKKFGFEIVANVCRELNGCNQEIVQLQMNKERWLLKRMELRSRLWVAS